MDGRSLVDRRGGMRTMFWVGVTVVGRWGGIECIRGTGGVHLCAPAIAVRTFGRFFRLVLFFGAVFFFISLVR